jgi:hypothetical protein
MPRRKLNPQIKQIEAATRLIAGRKKSAQVVVSSSGVAYSAGLDAASPTALLPKGVYRADQLLAACDKMKYAEGIKLEAEQDGDNWLVVLVDMETRAKLAWQDCGDTGAASPPTSWKVTKEMRQQLKDAYTLAARLDSHQLRLIRFEESGVMSYLSPTVVAQWFHPGNSGEALEVSVVAVKRASTYRGGKLVGIGASDGKINFVYDDGAFLRVDKYDGASYDDTQLARVFNFSSDEDAPVWPMGNQQAADVLEKIAHGSKVSRAAGTQFFSTFEDSAPSAEITIAMPPSKYYKDQIELLKKGATEVQFSGPLAHWENTRLALYGTGYRAVISTAMTVGQAQQLGLTEEAD